MVSVSPVRISLFCAINFTPSIAPEKLIKKTFTCSCFPPLSRRKYSTDNWTRKCNPKEFTFFLHGYLPFCETIFKKHRTDFRLPENRIISLTSYWCIASKVSHSFLKQYNDSTKWEEEHPWSSTKIPMGATIYSWL